jgi:hypothetical protein
VGIALLLAVAVVGLETTRTVQAYFWEWPRRVQTRTIYNHNLVALSQTVRESGVDLAGISALYPLYYHDPWIYRYVAERDEHAVRWFDGRGCIVYPGASEDGQYAFSAATRLDPVLRDEFAEHAALVERVQLAFSDENPSFELWHWQGGQALRAALDQLGPASAMWVSSEVRFTQPEQRELLGEAPRFGDVMALLGYRLASGATAQGGASVHAGASVELVTYWRALRTVEAQDDWNTFVHLLDPQSAVIGGVDVLQCPPTGWQPGDIVVQVHRFRIADDAPQGLAYLEIGVYRRGSARLPVWAGEAIAGDRVLLGTLRIE